MPVAKQQQQGFCPQWTTVLAAAGTPHAWQMQVLLLLLLLLWLSMPAGPVVGVQCGSPVQYTSGSCVGCSLLVLPP